MPIVGCHQKTVEHVLMPKTIRRAVMLTHERPGLLTASLESLFDSYPTLDVRVYDDGSMTREKLDELDMVEESGVAVSREPSRGLVRAWLKVFFDLGHAVDHGDLAPDDGVVLLEDDLLFASGWGDVLLKMAGGVEELGLRPGAMTCFRCHPVPQSEVRDLYGVPAFQTMQHGFQVNMVPAFVFQDMMMLEEAARKSEAGAHGLDVWFVGLLSHRKGLTNFCSERSWVAHVGAGRSIAEQSGFKPFLGIGYELVPELLKEASEKVGGLF